MPIPKGCLPTSTELKGDNSGHREYYVGLTQFSTKIRRKELQTGYKLGTGYVKARTAG